MTDKSEGGQYREALRQLEMLELDGWSGLIEDVDLAVQPGPKACLYLYDRITRWTWMASAPLSGFHAVSQAGRKLREVERRSVIDSLAVLATQIADGRLHPGPDDRQALGLLTSMYAGGTKTYASEAGFPDGCHFVVMVYRKPGGDAVKLRPFAFKADPAMPVSADTLMQLVRQGIQIDRVRHPAWLDGEES